MMEFGILCTEQTISYILLHYLNKRTLNIDLFMQSERELFQTKVEQTNDYNWKRKKSKTAKREPFYCKIGRKARTFWFINERILDE